MDPSPPRFGLHDPASRRGEREALALAARLTPLLSRADATLACFAALAEAATDAGLAVTVRDVVGHRVLVARAGPAVPASAGAAPRLPIGLCAALDVRPAGATRGAVAAATLVPSGVWSACLALGATVAAAAHDVPGVTAIIEAAIDQACQADVADDADDWLDALHAAQELLIGGDGGLPFSDGRHLMLPVTAAVRGALWAELVVDLDALPAELDPALRARAERVGAATLLAEALTRLPRWAPAPGPLLRALHDGFAAVADPSDTAWLDDLVDPARQHVFFAMLQPREQTFVDATQRPSVTVTRMDAGERPDALPRRARAVLDIRAPADRDVRALWPDIAQLASPVVQVRQLAARPAQLLLPPHPVFAALRSTLDSSDKVVGILAVQARREQRGTFWQQHATPVLGLAPAWPGLDVDAELAISDGALPVPADGLAWGAALYARLVLVDLCGAGSGSPVAAPG